ncbi:E3 ubiquitin-protein ligase RGLG2, partial [Linum perenne]
GRNFPPKIPAGVSVNFPPFSITNLRPTINSSLNHQNPDSDFFWVIIDLVFFLSPTKMGGKSSKGSRSGRRKELSSSHNSSNHRYAPPSPAPQQYYAPQNHLAVPPATAVYGYPPQRGFDRKYSRITDDYQTLEQVTAALSQAGLESSNLIVGIDFTKSNEWTGARSFNHKSLHHICTAPNPYEQAISIIGRTLSAFDEDNLIPCYGFGDSSTHDQDLFSFYPEGRTCHGFEEVLSRYREIVPQLRLAGPTSFAPIVEMGITIVEESGGQYHVLVIIADGQVTRSVDTRHGHMSPQEKKTIDAIVKASDYPLSIILVGVGDGPWDMMREFDDNIPARAFDNFQFVNFTEIMAKNVNMTRKETEFALSALMEIPSQYKATLELGLLGRRKGSGPERVALPPPVNGASPFSKSFRSPSFHQGTPVCSSYGLPVAGYGVLVDSSPYSSSSDHENKVCPVCPVCLSNPKNMAFGCGHQTCFVCGEDLQTCPICRCSILAKIRLYG